MSVLADCKYGGWEQKGRANPKDSKKEMSSLSILFLGAAYGGRQLKGRWEGMRRSRKAIHKDRRR